MLSQNESFRKYCESIKKLKQESINAGMSEEEFERLYFESLELLEHNNSVISNRTSTAGIFIKNIVKLFFCGLIIYILWNYKEFYSNCVCNLQDYIYPGLKFLRRLSIPLVSLFPSLTDFYHESCLIQNPFFTVVDMDCWPCSSVNNVGQIHDPKPVNREYMTPFIYESEQKVIDMERIEEMYLRNKDLIDRESPKVLMNNKISVNPDKMFKIIKTNEKTYFVWRFNTMNAARILRQIIPRPKVVPKFGQSTERFLIINSSQDSFLLPDTECSNSFILALKGTRLINLKPAEECIHQCKPLRVELKETNLLWYNWWYWRPEVLSSGDNETMIMHIGSYC